MSAVTMVSQSIAAGGLSGARPALTLCLLQVYAHFFAQTALPPELAWLASGYAIIVVAAAAVAEAFARSDPHIDEILHTANVIVGVVASVATALLIVGLQGEPLEAERTAQASLQMAGIAQGLLSVQGLAVLAAPLASLGTSWTRRRIVKAIDVVPVRKRWWRWLETGTVAGGMAAVLLLPALAVVVSLILVIGSIVVAGSVWGAQRALDSRARRACECGQRVRKEATLCPKCGKVLEPEVKLGQPKKKESEEEA